MIRVGYTHVPHPYAALSSSKLPNTARLACVRPPASVHPEPGSNSPLYVFPYRSLAKIDYALVSFPYLVVVISIISINDLLSYALKTYSFHLQVQKYK